MAKASEPSPKKSFGKMVRPSSDDGRVMVQQLLDDEVEVGTFLCNFDHTQKENASVLFAASRPSEMKPKDFVGQTIDVVYWVCQKMLVPGRGGEDPSIVIRTTVIDKVGKVFSCTSKGVAKSIDVLRQTLPDIPWDPPIRLKLIATDIGKGGDFYMLCPQHIADDAAATPPGAE